MCGALVEVILGVLFLARNCASIKCRLSILWNLFLLRLNFWDLVFFKYRNWKRFY